MIRLATALMSAMAAIGSIGQVAAQEAQPSRSFAERVCAIHGDGCEAKPDVWNWQRIESQSGDFSVEMPCDARQALEFGMMFTLSDRRFRPDDTRACAKVGSAFSAGLVGYAGLPDGETQSAMIKAFGDAPDMFTAIVRQISATTLPVTDLKGYRMIANTHDRSGRKSKTVLVEVGRFGVILLSADVLADFPGTAEEGAAAADRFLASLEIAE